MSTTTAPPAATVEQALAAAPGMMTVPQLRTKTGLDEKTVRAELRRLAGLGQIEHIPGRGRYDGRYGLTTTRAEGGEADVKPTANQSAEIPLDDSNQGVAADLGDNADPEPGDDLTTRAVKLAVRNHNKRLDAQAEEFSLLGVIAEIRAAIGDHAGKIMLGELAEHIRARATLLEAEPAALRAEIAKANAELDEIRATLHERIGGEIDPSDMSEAEIARAAALVIDRHDDELLAQAGTIIEQRALVEDLRSEIDRLKSEAVAMDTLEAAMPGFGAAWDAQQKVAGYLVRAPKRPLRAFTKSESAQAAAMAAARNGCGRGEVFALVPVGAAVRCAEWRSA